MSGNQEFIVKFLMYYEMMEPGSSVSESSFARCWWPAKQRGPGPGLLFFFVPLALIKALGTKDGSS